MSKYQELLDELNAERANQDAMIKSMAGEGQDDKEIAAAAEGEGGDEDDNDDEDEDGETFGKSLTLQSGELAIDATEILKSLQDDLGEQGELLAKALPQIGGLIRSQNEIISKQGDMIKSLNARVDQLAGTGRGRKTIVTIAEKTDAASQMAKSQNQGFTQEEFMLKANNAFDKKIISGAELNTIDVCLRNGYAVDDALVNKVTNA